MSESTYGQFDFIPEDLVPEAALDLTLSPVDLTTHWQRCSLLSNLMASYVTAAYRDRHQPGEGAAHNALSTVFQELMENAAKFSRPRDSLVHVRLKHFDRVVLVEMSNDSGTPTADRLEKHVQGLLSAPDLDEVYIKTMESRSPDDAQSGIGLLLLMKDYPVKLGVKFSGTHADYRTVTVRAHYLLEEV